MKKFLDPVLCFLELSALGTVALYFYLMIKSVEAVHWLVFIRNARMEARVILPAQILFAVTAYLLFKGLKKELFQTVVRGAAPLILLYGLLFLPMTYTNLIAFCLIVPCGVFGALCRSGLTLAPLEEKKRLCALLAVSGGLLGAAYGIYLQFYNVYHLSLVFSDWSVYVLAYMDMAAGWFSAPWKFFNAGGHFNLLPNIIGTLLYSVTSAPFAIFVLNSLLIYSAVPCTYFAARSSGLAPLHALLFSLGLLFHFTLANLNTCTFYGYHPNVYLLPLFLLFWGFFVQKKYRQAAVFFALSLLVQETFAVLWFGFGTVLLLFEKGALRKAGAILTAAMPVWFFLVTRVLMSWGNAENAAKYQQMFHYSNLGNTVPEILLSPFLRTEVFFKELLALENFYFAFFLLAGFLAALFYSKLLVMLLPPLLGVFLLNNTELSNTAMQYQAEFFVVLAAASCMGLKVAGDKSRSCQTAALAAVLCGMVLCGTFGGLLPWSVYSGIRRQKQSCYSRILRLKEIIPPGKTIQTTLAYQAHFIGRNKLLDFGSKKIEAGADYVLLPADDPLTNRAELRQLLEQLLSSPEWEQGPIDPLQEGVLVMIRRGL